MSIVKSFSVGDGDMYYIKHNNDSFTMIDCCMSEDAEDEIIEEIKTKSKGKAIIRFISTHPDDDHIRRLDDLDDGMKILNFYGSTYPSGDSGFGSGAPEGGWRAS